MSAITFGSGKCVEASPLTFADPSTSQPIEQERYNQSTSSSQNEPTPPRKQPVAIPIPFPHRVIQSKRKEEADKEILETI